MIKKALTSLTRNVGYGDRASVGCLLSSGACNVNSNGNVNWNNVNNDNNGVAPDLFLIFVCLQEERAWIYRIISKSVFETKALITHLN